ncbi:NAD-dependent epimerase/dehydratase family protein [Alloacidobacterium dinghuense]|uniref:NAD-dependent epimerase/dehydratase family protein n=2 Tax=Alloacidobacterium dinghuense TaxID=2763107 RepID=A0A7G8BR63_9BACT|nr:NAD-dependent epimerase/dehydratase family protein [Alloacidobacterium dinghuense]
MESIALIGASGSLGKSIAAALSARSTRYRVIGRSESSLKVSFGADPLASLVSWNPDSPESIRRALADIDTAIYMVGVNYWQFELHPQLIKKTLDGAVAAGVKKLLLIGTVYPFGRPQAERVSEDHPRQPHTFKGRMRKEQEDLVLAAHETGKIQTAILRLPDFYGPGVDKSFLWSAFQSAKTGKRAQLVGPIDTPHEFVYIPDAGATVARLIATRGAWSKAWNLGGAGVTSTRAMAAEIFAQAGRKPKYTVAGKTMLRIFGLFNPMVRELVEMHYLQTSPVILDDTRLKDLLGELPKTPYKEGIRQTLASI